MNKPMIGQHPVPPLVFDAAGDSSAKYLPRPAQVVVLTICVWGGSFALSTLRDMAEPPAYFATLTLVRLIATCLGGLLCWPIRHLLDKLSGAPIAAQFAAVLLLSAVVATAYNSAIQSMAGLAGLPVVTAPSWIFYNIVYWGMFFVAWSALYLVLVFQAIAVGRIGQARELERYAHAASTRALRYQLDPHFLFNTLNVVSALVVTRQNEAADAMLDRLAFFFRATLVLDPLATLSLNEEIDLQRVYLEIEQVRFPDLTVEIDIDDQAGACQIPALLLQPLVENAIKFGVASQDGPARICIKARKADDRLEIMVEDDGTKSRGGQVKGAEGGTGTGLANVHARLLAQFGARAGLQTFWREEGGFAAFITIREST